MPREDDRQAPSRTTWRNPSSSPHSASRIPSPSQAVQPRWDGRHSSNPSPHHLQQVFASGSPGRSPNSGGYREHVAGRLASMTNLIEDLEGALMEAHERLNSRNAEVVELKEMLGRAVKMLPLDARDEIFCQSKFQLLGLGDAKYSTSLSGKAPYRSIEGSRGSDIETREKLEAQVASLEEEKRLLSKDNRRLSRMLAKVLERGSGGESMTEKGLLVSPRHRDAEDEGNVLSRKVVEMVGDGARSDIERLENECVRLFVASQEDNTRIGTRLRY